MAIRRFDAAVAALCAASSSKNHTTISLMARLEMRNLYYIRIPSGGDVLRLPLLMLLLPLLMLLLPLLMLLMLLLLPRPR